MIRYEVLVPERICMWRGYFSQSFYMRLQYLLLNQVCCATVIVYMGMHIIYSVPAMITSPSPSLTTLSSSTIVDPRPSLLRNSVNQATLAKTYLLDLAILGVLVAVCCSISVWVKALKYELAEQVVGQAVWLSCEHQNLPWWAL
jgi:hypothetical protein